MTVGASQLAVPRKPYFFGLEFVGEDLICKVGVHQGYSGQFGPLRGGTKNV